MDPSNPRECQKAKFGVGLHLFHKAGGVPRLEAVLKCPQKVQFAWVVVQRSSMATTQFQCMNGSNQPKRVPKSQIWSSTPCGYQFGITMQVKLGMFFIC